MITSIDDHNSMYEQAMTAYMGSNYEAAADLIDQVVQNFADDPNSRLLRGHVYYVLQQYDIARDEYQQVLQLTDEPATTSQAHDGLQNIEQYLLSLSEYGSQLDPYESMSSTELSSNSMDEYPLDETDLSDIGMTGSMDSTSFNLKSLNDYPASLDTLGELSLSDPFDISTGIEEFDEIPDTIAMVDFVDNPFASPPQSKASASSLSKPSELLDLPPFLPEDITEFHIQNFTGDDPAFNVDENLVANSNNDIDYSPFAAADLTNENHLQNLVEPVGNESDFAAVKNSQGEDNFVLAKEKKQGNLAQGATDLADNKKGKLSELDNNSHQFKQVKEPISLNSLNNDEIPSSFLNNSFEPQQQQMQVETNHKNNSFDDDSFDLEAFESAFGSESFTGEPISANSHNLKGEDSKGEVSQSSLEFLNEFDEFDDLGDIPGFELTGNSSFSDVSLLTDQPETSRDASPSKFMNSSLVDDDREEELFTITGSQEVVPNFTQTNVSKIEPNVTVEQGLFAFYENASMDKKQWFIAGTVGLASAVVVALVNAISTSIAPPGQRESMKNSGTVMVLAAGIAGAATAGFMGNLTLREIRRTTKDLQNQFDAIRQGNLHAQATVYTEDELGYLATGFNDMSRVIFTITNEAQRKARDQEEDKETLQRQVIRLLDDVEGAARGDLTVQAEVTADVLGAVADAFNLTIQNLRDIVQQVKFAAQQVTKGSTNSETFARALSSDALRQAEELGVTLNSVQVMTESIQRVAEAAREAESVAHDASTIALKGGEAVENTVAGILEIRETVAETTRKVKRLAESSQEISKIVALISQIASRTNLLALNASIEAARAGEAGRGFAIVADEVRQLADKSAKSLKEIEQIVMQIQSETNSVMSAMEEGTQQVIKGTKLAEEAKRSLENIIQVANRIDTLVRSITSDTVEQTETSRAVAQVMQSVELTAQETSQEAQRVSGALQQLVGVSRDLISSVERFRVETVESR